MLINKNKFWEYAYSDFLDNRNRGALAEYIVAEALGVTNETPYSSWESYDLEYKGLKIEVKTSAYVQTWKQNELSNPSFGIPKKQGWIGETNLWDGEITRHADVYVFCLLTLEDKEPKKVLDTKYWDFYIVKTSEINEKLKDQKSMGLSTFDWLTHIKCNYSELAEKLNQIISK